MTSALDQKRAASFGGVIVATIGAAAALPMGTLLVAGSCVVATLKSPATAVAVILVLLFLRIGNPALIPAQDGIEVATWAGLLAASVRIWLEAFRRGAPVLKMLPPFFLPYAAILIPLSALLSTLPSVSLAKAISFTLVVSSVCLGFWLVRQQGRPASSLIKGLWIAVLVLSLPTFLIPSIGYLRDGQGFQGILNHPQGLAVFLAPVVAWSAVKAFSAEGRGRAIFVGLLLLSFGSLWLTRGRTGLAAILLATLVLIVLRPGFWRSLSAIALRALSQAWVLVGIILLLPVIVWKAPQLISAFQEFVLKGSGADAISGAALASRGFIVDQQILNFQENPVFGIGFGVSNSETHALNVVIDPFTGLPIMAATEKANLLLAVLEETGIVGSLAFAPFFFMLLVRLARTPSLAVAWAALAALGTNISEMTFFSMGGIGLYTWLIMAWALSEHMGAAQRRPHVRRAPPRGDPVGFVQGRGVGARRVR